MARTKRVYAFRRFLLPLSVTGPYKYGMRRVRRVLLEGRAQSCALCVLGVCSRLPDARPRRTQCRHRAPAQLRVSCNLRPLCAMRVYLLPECVREFAVPPGAA